MQDKLQRITISTPWLGGLFVVIIADALGGLFLRDPEAFVGHLLTSVVCTVFLLDVGLRVFAFGPRVFFSKPWNIFDSVVVWLTAVITLTSLIGFKLENRKRRGLLWLSALVRAARFLRMTTLVRRTCPALRRVTGENKRRFVSAEHDMDLDLAYITQRLIGMSVPATGCAWLYRNPLNEVVRFFETFYAGHYLIVNACPEIPYPASSFRTGQVETFDVQDHAPPRLEQLVRFLELARVWYSADVGNIVAVHCRGGKGRTGSFCCAWLLYSHEAEDARDALTFFAVCRTDTNERFKTKVQGVETRSQVRYVEYMAQWLHQQKCFFPQRVELPKPAAVRLKELRLLDVFAQPAPEELVVVVQDVAQGSTVCVSGAGTRVFDLVGAAVQGDVRVGVYGRGSLSPGTDLAGACARAFEVGTPKGEKPACIFYFFFHTSFLVGERLELEASAVDGIGKSQKELVNENGSVELSFSGHTARPSSGLSPGRGLLGDPLAAQ